MIERIFGTHLPFGADGEFTNFTANRNWMAHTNKQHKFRDNVRAHNANVTSYTTANSSGAEVVGAEIFSKNNSARRASSKLTRHSSASDVKASSVEAFALFPLLTCCRGCGAPWAIPFGILGGATGAMTGIGAGGGPCVCWWCPPGLMLAEVCECLEESKVETLRGRWWCGRRGMFWYRCSASFAAGGRVACFSMARSAGWWTLCRLVSRHVETVRTHGRSAGGRWETAGLAATAAARPKPPRSPFTCCQSGPLVQARCTYALRPSPALCNELYYCEHTRCY